jgi:hypothetical protein
MVGKTMTSGPIARKSRSNEAAVSASVRSSGYVILQPNTQSQGKPKRASVSAASSMLFAEIEAEVQGE